MPLNHWRLRLQAMAWLLAGRREKAEAVFGRMLEIWPTDAYALSSRSFLRAQSGRGDAAIEDAQRLVAAHPARGAGDWFNLGFLLDAARRDAEAVAAFERALALDPKFDRAWYGMGLALQRQGRQEEALAALKRNTELQPMSPYGWYHLARVHADCQHPDEARRIIRHLRGFEPRIAEQLERETGLLAS
ncbi:tetratricopeptide repeat protein [Variovorax dokdonensis]|uniref:Tetratricopeptide repeat protein n=1 Tax=Variovorax dokdonensis TaxID=344883 RepID=A0ABT7NAH9_9BURK|nr:tetratricopeptide repeat protein [Variovorax dokdonensis]MDM0044937.1 tetratricopeptide repeat protein [Variovorax dokdonensis]